MEKLIRQPIALLIPFLSTLFFGAFFFKETPKVENKAEIVSDYSHRITRIEVPCLGFDGKVRNRLLLVLDVLKEEVKDIFAELFMLGFPIYVIYGFAARHVRNASSTSLHAYGAAIDINVFMNPYFDAVKLSFFPMRFANREKDRLEIIKGLKITGCTDSEIPKVLDVIIQPKESDDRFLNRSKIRKGMVTEDIVQIFKRHGFSIWGGNWRNPIDFMHFQLPRELAEKLVNCDIEEGKKIWKEHVRSCQ